MTKTGKKPAKTHKSGELPQAMIITGGLTLAVVTFALGLLFTTKEQKTEENKE